MINNSFAELLKKQFFGNTLQDYLITLFLFIGLTLLLFIFKKILLKYVKGISLKTKNDFDDFFVGIFEHINFIFFVFIAFYISLKSININKTLDKVIALIFILTLTIKIVQILQLFLAYCIKKVYLKDETDTATKDTLNTIIKILSGVLWTGGIVFILDNIGINISAIVAGIGITGVAVALAAQAILGDLFSYGDFSLIYEIVYYIFSSDYNLYMDIQQKINLSIKEIFDKESIEFAYPTQTLFVVKQFK